MYRVKWISAWTLHSSIPYFRNTSKTLYDMCHATSIFHDARRRQMTQAIIWLKHGRLVLTISVRRGLRPFQGRHSLENACCQSCLKFRHEVCDSPGKDWINTLLQVSPREKKNHLRSTRRQWRPCNRPSTSSTPSWIYPIQPLLYVFRVVGWSSVALKPQPVTI
jgi:hypothetical protein